MAEPLPTLIEEADLRTLLRHARVGNVLGFAVYYVEEDAAVARLARINDEAGLGRCILDVYNEVNDGVEDTDIELGTDLFFRSPDEGDANPDTTLILLKAPDIDHLLENLPGLVLDRQTDPH